MIIGISGKIGNGKDTVGKIIQYLTRSDKEKNLSFEEYNFAISSFKIKKFAGKLKQIVSILTGIPVEDLEKQEVKDRVLGEEWNRTFFKIIDSDDTVLFETFYKEDAELELCYYKDYHHRTVELIEFQNRPITVRQLLQEIGTEALRNVIHPNVWVNALFADYKLSEESIVRKTKSGQYYDKKEYPNWIITDMRFPNELKAVKDRDGISIRVNRVSQWERELRQKLQETLPEGSYDLSTENMTLITGKRGKIDFEVALRKEVNSYSEHPSETALDNAEFDYVINNNGFIEDLIESVKTILNEISHKD